MPGSVPRRKLKSCFFLKQWTRENAVWYDESEIVDKRVKFWAGGG